MSEELLPCPFCGEEPFGYEIEAHEHSDALKAIIPGIPDHKGSYVVECACGAGHIDDTKDACVARWNRRAAASRASLEAVPDVEALADKIAECLRCTYHCTRVWEAWHVGTMSQDDFEPVDESETPREIAEEIVAMLSAAPAQPAQQRP